MASSLLSLRHPENSTEICHELRNHQLEGGSPYREAHPQMRLIVWESTSLYSFPPQKSIGNMDWRGGAKMFRLTWWSHKLL